MSWNIVEKFFLMKNCFITSIIIFLFTKEKETRLGKNLIYFLYFLEFRITFRFSIPENQKIYFKYNRDNLICVASRGQKFDEIVACSRNTKKNKQKN